MQSERIKQAAERLRKFNAHEPNEPGKYPSISFDDALTLANAYLSADAADDDEAITEEWCMQAFESLNRGLWSLGRIHCQLEQRRDVFAVEHHEGVVLRVVKTRGQLRRLIAALTETES